MGGQFEGFALLIKKGMIVMTNMISADLFRLRKGMATKGMLIGVLATILLIGIISFAVTTEGVQMLMEDGVAMVESGLMSEGELVDIQTDMKDTYEMLPDNAAGFGRMIIGENFLAPFFLTFIVVIFAGDYSTGTYRNTLSYESDRTKIYVSKLLLSMAYAIGLSLAALLFSWLLGGILFGFTGFSAAYFQKMGMTLLLLLPAQLATVTFGHFLVAFTKKTGTTIAIYLVTLLVGSSVLQMLAMLPGLKWLLLIDWMYSGKQLASYWTMATGDILISVISGLVMAALFFVLGLLRYRKTDMA